MGNHSRLFRQGSIVAIFATILISSAAWMRLENGERKHSQNDSLFSVAEYSKHVEFLAGNDLEGRETGQEGNNKAADYIAKYFAECGVRPAGDDGTYFQTFDLPLNISVGPDTSLVVKSQNRKFNRHLRLNNSYVPFSFSKSSAFEGEVVFAGYGIVNKEMKYNDFRNLDASGKVVMMLRYAPKFKDFPVEDMLFRTKATRANAQDAAAILIVNPIGDDESDELVDLTRSFRATEFFDPGSKCFGVPMLQIKRKVADRMLAAAGLPTLAALQQKIEDTHKPASRELKGVSIKGVVDLQPANTPVRNVVGLIPGSGDLAEKYIVMGAHYDHLGIQHKNSENFDAAKDIFNGADDNASGTAMIMTMAKAFSGGSKPKHSLLLMAFTGEELGLLGSQYFVEHPTVNLEKIAIMLDFDMVGRLRNNNLSVFGADDSGYTKLLKSLAPTHDLAIRHSMEMDFGGSDNAYFQMKNIPTLFFFTGMHNQYHQPTDDVNLINAKGAIRIAKLAADLIDEIDAGYQPSPTSQKGEDCEEEENWEEDEWEEEESQEMEDAI